MAGFANRPGGDGDGDGDGSGAFGAVLKQGDDASRGLFIYGDETDPSWHLRGVERETEEEAIRPSAIYENVANTARLTLTFGDAATDEKLFSPTRGFGDHTPEQVNRFPFTHQEYPNPAALPAAYEVNDRLTVRWASAGAGGNGNYVRMQEGRAAVAATAPGTPYLPATDDDSSTVGNTLQVNPFANDASGNGVEISVVRQVAAAAASLVMDNVGGNPALRVTFPNGAVHNGTRVEARAPETVTAAAAQATINLGAPTLNRRRVSISYATTGPGGNGFTVRVLVNSAGGTVSTAVYDSATQLTITVGATGRRLDAVVGIINAARHNGSQLVTATAIDGAGGNVGATLATASTTQLAGGRAATTETAGSTFWNPNTKRLEVAIGTTSTATTVAGWINADSDFPGTAAVISGQGAFSIRRELSDAAAGGANASGSASGTVTWAPTGGRAGAGKLTIWTDGTLTVTAAAAAINASGYGTRASVFGAGREAWTLNVQEYVFSGGVNGVARSPLTADQDQVSADGGVTFQERLVVSGVVPNVDTIADLIRVYEATRTSSRNYVIVGTGTDRVLTASVAENDLFVSDAQLSGGRDQLTKQAVHVQLTSASGAYRIRYYGANTPVALRSTIGELESAWRSIGGSQTVSPAITVTGDDTEKVDPASLPSSPSGGRNYTPPSIVEFLVRDEDEADGKNIEVRYDPARDTLQDILDASLEPASNPGGAKVIDIFGTDLTAAPEEPPVTRPMYPEAGATSSPASGQTAAQVRDTVTAFLDAGDNIAIARSGNTLTITSTASGDGGGTGGLDAEAVRDTVAAFLRGTPSSAIAFTHDDAANTLTLAIANATETVPGLVRNVSIDEAADTNGTVFRAWSSPMITKLIAVWRTPISPTEAAQGTNTNLRWWSAIRVRQAIAAFTNAFTAAEKAKLGGIEAGAQVNPTDAEIKAAYEQNADTNAFTDADETKLDGIEAGAQPRNPRAFVGASESGGEITLTREGGTDPVDLPVTGAGGAFELMPVGSRSSFTFASTLIATGITPPMLDPDEAIYLRIAVPGESEPPHYFVMRGATYADLTVAAAGDAPSGTRWQRAGPVTAGVVEVQKTATGELLIASGDSAGSNGWLEVYSVGLGAGGSLGFIPLGSANYNVSVGSTFTAEAAGQTPIDMSSVDPANDIIGVKVDFASGDSTFDDIRLVDARALLSVDAGTALTAGQTARPTLGGNAAVTGPSLWLSIDSDGHLAVTAAGVTTDPMPLTLWRFGRATAVAPNPPGTDGATLARLKVQGKNYNLPGSSLFAAVKMNLQDVASGELGTAYSNSHFRPTLTGARWNIGGFSLDGNGIVMPAAGMYQIHSEVLFVGNSGWNTIFTRYRIERNGAVLAPSVSEGSTLHRGSSAQPNSVIEHDDWHLLQAGDKLVVDFQGDQAGRTYSVDGSRSLFVIIGFHAPAGAAPAPAAHNRYIGWSAAQNPTTAEFGAASAETDDILDVPALPAQFATAGGAYVWLAVPKTQGRPTGIYRSGNQVNQISAFAQVNDWTPSGEAAHYVYATNAQQSATSLAGGSFRIEYGS